MFYMLDLVTYIFQFKLIEKLFKAFVSLCTWTTLQYDSDFKYITDGKCELKVGDQIGNFSCHRYPNHTTIKFAGWKPLIWSDSEYNYVSGLPEAIVGESIISVENVNNGEKILFTHRDGIIDWNDVFDRIVEHTFHDDLD